MIFLAFGHRKSVGKDTAARFLCSHLRIQKKGIDVYQCGFADKVKDIAHQLYKWAGVEPGDYYEQDSNIKQKEIILPRIGKSPRQVWIELGTNVGRSVYYHTWVDYLYYSLNCDICIIKDLRFPNEADRILALGGCIFKINRPSIEQTSDVADDALVGYNKWSGEIENNDNMADFHNAVIDVAGSSILKQLEET